jgi:hypothetical protein
MSKVIVVVNRGRVESVYARNKDIEVEVLDMDSMDPDEIKDREKRLKAVENSKSYKDIL